MNLPPDPDPGELDESDQIIEALRTGKLDRDVEPAVIAFVSTLREMSLARPRVDESLTEFLDREPGRRVADHKPLSLETVVTIGLEDDVELPPDSSISRPGRSLRVGVGLAMLVLVLGMISQLPLGKSAELVESLDSVRSASADPADSQGTQIGSNDITSRLDRPGQDPDADRVGDGSSLTEFRRSEHEDSGGTNRSGIVVRPDANGEDSVGTTPANQGPGDPAGLVNADVDTVTTSTTSTSIPPTSTTAAPAPVVEPVTPAVTAAEVARTPTTYVLTRRSSPTTAHLAPLSDQQGSGGTDPAIVMTPAKSTPSPSPATTVVAVTPRVDPHLQVRSCWLEVVGSTRQVQIRGNGTMYELTALSMDDADGSIWLGQTSTKEFTMPSIPDGRWRIEVRAAHGDAVSDSFGCGVVIADAGSFCGWGTDRRHKEHECGR